MEVKKLLTAAGMTAVLVFGAAASCQEQEPREFYPVEFPDCDADDKVGKWDTADCGPSPLPMKTAYQPAPSKKPTVARTKRR